MNILLTGSAGFIGKNLYEGLKNEYEVFSPTHRQLDIVDESAVRKYIIDNKIKVVIHSAVNSENNVLENILKMFFSIYKNIDFLDKVINFGSGAEYAKTRDLKKVKETELGKFIPEDNYGLGKLICNQISKNNKKIVTLLPFGIFGRYEDYRFKFITNSIVKNILGLPIKIKQDVVFDYLYIDDLIPIIEFFLRDKKRYGDFNITPNQSVSLKKIVEIINKISKKPSKIIIENKEFNFQYTGSNLKLKQAIPHLKITSYRDAISNLYKYYLKNFRSLDKNAIIQDDYIKIAKIKK